jgi:hypothetical protein
MELGCVVAIAMGVVILVYIVQSISSKSSKPHGRTGDSSILDDSSRIKITGRDDLTSWALHKHPEDIDAHDYRDFSVLDADVVIHREGGVNKVVKGPDRGRILTDWEVDELEEDEL